MICGLGGNDVIDAQAATTLSSVTQEEMSSSEAPATTCYMEATAPTP